VRLRSCNAQRGPSDPDRAPRVCGPADGRTRWKSDQWLGILKDIAPIVGTIDAFQDTRQACANGGCALFLIVVTPLATVVSAQAMKEFNPVGRRKHPKA
jgi:hypothetical protein